MPIYDYRCARHGYFDVMKDMKLSGRPEPCPVCAEEAIRVYHCTWKAFVGSVRYDRLNNFPGGFKAGGTSAGDMKSIATEDW